MLSSKPILCHRVIGSDRASSDGLASRQPIGNSMNQPQNRYDVFEPSVQSGHLLMVWLRDILSVTRITSTKPIRCLRAIGSEVHLLMVLL